MSMLLLFVGCLVDRDTYEARRDALSDDDADGWTDADGDCDDADGGVYPGAPEDCDGVDQDCDGDREDGDLSWYADSDGDGFGAGSATIACEAPEPSGWAARDGDCDDGRAAVNPDAAEICGDGVDQDCTPGGCRYAGDNALEDIGSFIEGSADGVYLGVRDGADFNGDGYTDFVVAVPGEGLRFYHGGPRAAYGAEAAWVVGNEEGWERDAVVDVVGDINNDGLADMAAQSIGGPSYRTEVWCGDVASSPLLCATFDIGEIPTGFVGLGTGEGGSARWLVGGRSGDTTAQVVLIDGDEVVAEPLLGEPGSFGPVSMKSLGDMDGDGLDEAAVSVWAEDLRGIVYVLSGAEWGSLDRLGAAAAVLSGTVDGQMAGFLGGGADFDGDGLADLARGSPMVLAEGAGFAEVFTGGLPATGAAPFLRVDGVTPGDGFGASVALGDVDGDGAPDLLAGAPYADAGARDAGTVTLVHGPASGTYDALGAPRFTAGTEDGAAAATLATANADALAGAEVFVAAPGGLYLLPGADE
jgi:hypothetical protein